MKNNLLIALLLLLFGFATMKANNNDTDRNDKEYFSSFKKNEEPKNKKFNILNKKSEDAGENFYVIYKENALGEGFYFKIVLDENEKPIATYYANEDDQQISDTTVQNLKQVIFGPDKVVAAIGETTTQCVTKCHRKNGCYDKPTSTGVLLCSAECGIACA
ncbi:hypothetical protein CHRY9390_00539 [Chryseobacterium aquaeductus]|uniref:Uncharacterized protein n=1 Tax=Chryseobacterium aquaeductus TaxID=2675056 RepID=A0A9N8QPU3_9FLAO|nr:hypothetical protein [Chryseobacterium aquaeductus]CAA7329891.1 hypothetical protein CHRY9390_00539 [Chryseobacterium potabilaquae]CAD7799808.1 hypothetical protein CHRY9390_00539 [Chryseobacterium aquaeductus]